VHFVVVAHVELSSCAHARAYVTCVQVEKVQAFVEKVFPSEGMSLASGTAESSGELHMHVRSCCVRLGCRVIESTAQTTDVHSASGKSATNRHRSLSSAKLPSEEVSVLVCKFLGFCANTISQTLMTLLQGSPIQRQRDSVAASVTLLDPVFAAIDDCLGDLIAAQLPACVGADWFKGIAQHAATHTSSALATLRVRQPWQRFSGAALMSARRLWAALVPEDQDTSAAFAEDGGSDAAPNGAVSAATHCNAAGTMQARQTSSQLALQSAMETDGSPSVQPQSSKRCAEPKSLAGAPIQSRRFNHCVPQ
jgi:hypothetical protein